jgi:hypothetical protein
MTVIDEQSLQRIAAAVTPAVMVSACGLLALGLDNQAARMTTRIRELAREFRAQAGASLRKTAIQSELAILARRHGLYMNALLCNYGALLAFVLTSLLALAQGLFSVPMGLPVVAFTAGVLLLAAMAIFTLASVRLSRDAIRHEEAEVLHGTGEPP